MRAAARTNSNALLMGDALFDLRYVTVAPVGRFEFCRRIREDYENRRHYYDLAGTRIATPVSRHPAPDRERLE